MRIGITGPSGTGKTTLAVALSNRLGIPLAIEGAREAVAALGIPTAQAIDVTNALSFHYVIYDIKVRNEDVCGESFVADRPVSDCAAFWLFRELQGCLPNLENERDVHFSQIEMRLKAKPYDFILFLEPGSIPYFDDGFRVEDQEPMYALLLGVLYGRFRHILEATNTRIVIVPKEVSTLDSRVEFCLRTIQVSACGKGLSTDLLVLP